VTLPAFAAERRAAAPLLLSAGTCCSTFPAARPQLSTDISCSHGAHQQTFRTPLLLSIDGTDRRMGGQRDARPPHKPCSAYYTGSVNIFTFISPRRQPVTVGKRRNTTKSINTHITART